MSYITGTPASVRRIVRNLREMAEARGVITDEKRGWIMLAADRLEDLEERMEMADERIAIMEEGNGKTAYGEEQLSFLGGGDEHEKQ